MFRKQTPKEAIKESRRSVGRSARELERELNALKLEEKKMIQQIKLAARQGNDATTRILAKSLVRLRAQMTKLTAGSAQLKGVSTQMMAVGATHTVSEALKKATGAMQSVSKATDVQKMPQTMAQFMRENEKIDMAQELTADAIDSAFDTEEIDEETDEVMNQVLDEIGIDVTSQLAQASTPQSKRAPKQTAQTQQTSEEEELLRRLDILKN